MRKQKFSINISQERLEQLDRYIEVRNKQFSDTANRADVIRTAIRWFLVEQNLVPGARIDDKKWVHSSINQRDAVCDSGLDVDPDLLVGIGSGKMTCPRCILKSRHLSAMGDLSVMIPGAKVSSAKGTYVDELDR